MWLVAVLFIVIIFQCGSGIEGNVLNSAKNVYRNPRDIRPGHGYIPGDPIQQNKSSNPDPKRTDKKDGGIMSDLPLVKLGDGYYFFGTKELNFFKAGIFCREHRLELLSIETKEENDHISDYIAKNFKDIAHIWTSGSDLQDEGKYIWTSTLLPFNYTNWEIRQPDNFLLAEDCIEIHKVNGRYYWNDDLCSYRHAFICEFKK